MKLFNLAAEMTALRTVTAGTIKTKNQLISTIDQTWFHDTRTREVMARILKVSKQRAEVPDYASLISDPVLSEDSRDLLKQHRRKTKPIQKSKNLPRLVENLDKYRKLRIMYKMCVGALETFKGDAVDVDEVMDQMAGKLMQARRATSIEDAMNHIGKGDNVEAKVRKLLKGEVAKFVPTGFKEFDNRSDGLRLGSCVILSANTGGLKSTVAKTLAHHFYENQMLDTCYVSLEMDFAETMFRLFASTTDIDQRKFLRGTLSKQEQETAMKAYQRMTKVGQKNGCRFTVLSNTEEDLGIDNIFASLKPLGFKVVLIDYVTLLSDADNDQQWKALGYVARKAKLFAKKHGALVVLLAQMSDDADRIRYSGSIKEHADNWWWWRIDEKARDTGQFTVHQGKARNQEIYDFDLAIDWPRNKIMNPGDLFAGKEGKSSEGRKVRGKKGKGGDFDVTEDTTYLGGNSNSLDEVAFNEI